MTADAKHKNTSCAQIENRLMGVQGNADQKLFKVSDEHITVILSAVQSMQRADGAHYFPAAFC